jgi:diguanylate cyclase (GGDEF)-like protein
VARYGGEEFTCLMPECDRTGALAKAEALRVAIEQLAIPHAASPVAPGVTLSIGVAVVVPGDQDQPRELVSLADLALYKAKKDGRNRVCNSG